MTTMESTPLLSNSATIATSTTTGNDSNTAWKRRLWLVGGALTLPFVIGLVVLASGGVWTTTTTATQSVASSLSLWGHAHHHHQQHHHHHHDADKIIDETLQKLDAVMMNGRVLFPKDGKSFTEAWKEWNEIAASRIPRAVVQVASPDDVSLAVPVLVRACRRSSQEGWRGNRALPCLLRYSPCP